MPTSRVSDVKAADPGIGFTLNFDSALGSTLRVVITMTDLQQPTKGNYTSEVTLNNTISDTELVFVVPFGDKDYAPSNCLKFQIDLYTPNNPVETLTGVVVGENGVFNFSTSVPKVVHDFPKTGDMLQSEDGAFIGIYQKDGNFCVYPQFADHQSDLNPVYSTNTAVGSPTSFTQQFENHDHYYVCIVDSSSNILVRTPATFSTEYPLGVSIDSSGTLCFNGGNSGFTKY
jgi:hypothetical protein